jgi:hypothetical protein
MNEHILESVLDKIKKIKIMEENTYLYMDSLEILVEFIRQSYILW